MATADLRRCHVDRSGLPTNCAKVARLCPFCAQSGQMCAFGLYTHGRSRCVIVALRLALTCACVCLRVRMCARAGHGSTQPRVTRACKPGQTRTSWGEPEDFPGQTRTSRARTHWLTCHIPPGLSGQVADFCIADTPKAILTPAQRRWSETSLETPLGWTAVRRGEFSLSGQASGPGGKASHP